MSPSILRLLLIALFVCTPIANAIKCRTVGAGKDGEETCPSHITKCSIYGGVRSCAMKQEVCAPDTCCEGDMCNDERKDQLRKLPTSFSSPQSP